MMVSHQQELREDLADAEKLLAILKEAKAEGDKSDSLTPEWRRNAAIQDVQSRIDEIREELEDGE